MLFAFLLAVGLGILVLEPPSTRDDLTGSGVGASLLTPQAIPFQMGNIGGLASVVSKDTSADHADTVLLGTEWLDSTYLTKELNFVINFAGQIGSGGNGDLTLNLKWKELDGTETTLLAFTTVSAPNEDDKALIGRIVGRVLTDGASGKIVASGLVSCGFGTAQNLFATTALAGVAVDLSQAGQFELTADWDNTTDGADAVVEIFALSVDLANRRAA